MQENDEKIPEGMGKVEYYMKNPKKGTIAYYLSLGIQLMMKVVLKKGITWGMTLVTLFFGIEYGFLILLAGILEELLEKPIRKFADSLSKEIVQSFQTA